MRNFFVLLGIGLLSFVVGFGITVLSHNVKLPGIIETKEFSTVRLIALDTGRTFCSGSIINSKQVVTAGHCLAFSETNNIAVAVPTGADTYDSVTVLTSKWSDGRTDYGMLYGDFSKYAPLGIEVDPNTLENIMTNPKSKLISCGYPYNGKLACKKFKAKGHCNLYSGFYFQFCGNGFVYPGMSGGPIVDMDTGKVVGVNTAMAEGQVVVSPTVEIFNNLDVQQEK